MTEMVPSGPGCPSEAHSAGQTGVAYLTIVNKGATDDRLVSASTPVAQKAEPHKTINENGVMKMRPVDAIEVKAGGEAVLKPGGLHLMLTGLNGPLKAGTRSSRPASFCVPSSAGSGTGPASMFRTRTPALSSARSGASACCFWA